MRLHSFYFSCEIFLFLIHTWLKLYIQVLQSDCCHFLYHNYGGEVCWLKLAPKGSTYYAKYIQIWYFLVPKPFSFLFAFMIMYRNRRATLLFLCYYECKPKNRNRRDLGTVLYVRLLVLWYCYTFHSGSRSLCFWCQSNTRVFSLTGHNFPSNYTCVTCGARYCCVKCLGTHRDTRFATSETI